MYLVKQSNVVYYSRVCYPQALINIGYPFDIKVSLLTKDRATAVLRNLHISAIIKQPLSDESPLINRTLYYSANLSVTWISVSITLVAMYLKPANIFCPSINIQPFEQPSG